MILAILIIVAIVIITLVRYLQLKRRNKTVYPVNHLKDGLRLTIQPDVVEIKSREYWQESDATISRTSMLDGLYDSNRNNTQEKQSISVLIYKGEYNGQKVRFVSPPINKDEAQIRAGLIGVDELIIYVDPKNVNNYHFDIQPILNKM